jgi:hypothetical protein
LSAPERDNQKMKQYGERMREGEREKEREKRDRE